MARIAGLIEDKMLRSGSLGAQGPLVTPKVNFTTPGGINSNPAYRATPSYNPPAVRPIAGVPQPIAQTSAEVLEQIDPADVKSRLNRFTKPLGGVADDVAASPLAVAGKTASKALRAGISGGLGAVATDMVFPDSANAIDDVAAIKNWTQKNAPQPVAGDPLAAIKAKDAAITNTRTVPTLAGITPDQVQRPAAQRVSGLSSQKPVAIAGPAVPQGDTLKPGEQGGIIEITDTNDPKYRKVVRLPGVQQSQSVAGEQQVGSASQIGSTEYFLNQIDPTVRSLAPMKAMRIAGERADKFAATQLAKQEAEQKALLTGAQTDYYKAHADLYKAQASPEYLGRQERIAQIKDMAAQKKEQDKLDFDLSKTWVKGQTGMEHPDDIRTALSYVKDRDNFSKKFDAFVEKLPPASQQFWVEGFKKQEPSVLEQLKKRGIVMPAPPAFPARTPSTLGMPIAG